MFYGRKCSLPFFFLGLLGAVTSAAIEYTSRSYDLEHTTHSPVSTTSEAYKKTNRTYTNMVSDESWNLETTHYPIDHVWEDYDFLYNSYSDVLHIPEETIYEYSPESSEELFTYVPPIHLASEEMSVTEKEDKEAANKRFCDEARKEDEFMIKEPDGRYHPKFEEVSGIGYYRFHAKPLTWEQARRACEREGAHLVIINSEEEAKALEEIHARCPYILPTHFNSYIYVGLHDIKSEGNFETVFGEPLSETGYVKWAWNQPDNAHHYGENCIAMNRRGYFNDVPCTIELPFFCEHI